jgi:uncharacterized phiE125 gp8 family phage protein
MKSIRQFRVIEEPDVEPITVTEAKAHIRVTHTDDDTYIGTLISVARQYIEERTGRALINQTLQETWHDRFPTYFELARSPLTFISVIMYIDEDGVTQTLAIDQYKIAAYSDPMVIVPEYDITWPSTRRTTDAVTVRYIAGYGSTAASVPFPIRQAILMLVADMYVNRETIITGTIVSQREFAVDALCGPYRTF